MIETEQSVEIAAPIERVWDFAKDIRAWAGLMPGLQDCDIVDADNSCWTLKVGVGPLVRTVKVKVHVDRWAGPEAVDFTYELVGDPVRGGGTYRAHAAGPGRTALALAVRVEGSGPMAPMWEAMGKPLLPKFASGFAGQFRDEVEALAAGEEGVRSSPLPGDNRGLWARLRAWLRGLFGRPEQAHSGVGDSI